jgi:dTMP kinase
MSADGQIMFGTAPSLFAADTLSGKLIVIEGTDGVGRSTQIEILKQWLEVKGYGVMTTGWTRSPLMGKVIEDAKSGHTLNPHTYTLLYAADLADRLEHEIIPALRAGFVVLADRYVYTVFARSMVRGLDPAWTREVFAFALKPDAVLYMRIAVEDLIPRVINTRMLTKRYWEDRAGAGIDYWESGMDLKLGEDFYDSFVEYQRQLLAEFEKMVKEFGFDAVHASSQLRDTTRSLKKGVLAVLDGK